MQDAILRREPSKHETMVLKKTLSSSYPNMEFKEVLRKESQKLQLELQRSQANLDVGQCEVIQRLIDVTEAVAATSPPKESAPKTAPKKVERNYSDTNSEKNHPFSESSPKKSDTRTTSRLFSV